MAELRKLTRPDQNGVAKREAHDPELAKKFPNLHMHLVAVQYPDGSARQVCSVTFYGGSGAFKGFLNDRDSGASIGVESDSLQGLLRALEAELSSPQPSWFWRKGGEQHPAKNRGKRG